MEIRTFQLVQLVVLGFLFSIAFGSSSDAPHDRVTPTESSHEAIKPEFITEPKDRLILPNHRALLSCKAKFVTKLKFNCSGGVLLREIYLREDQLNKTKLILVTISKFTADNLHEISCVCEATGYSGLVLRSKAAAVKRAYLGENITILPSALRVVKNSRVTIECYPPAGLPSPTISWQKNGIPLDTHWDGRVEVINQDNFSKVVIREARTSDVGSYSCQVSNLVGRRSAEVKLNVYVDGGWSPWKELSSCSVECGNGTRMMKRICSNPSPENGGKICTGPYFKKEACQGICSVVEIICPDDISVYVNHSDVNTKVPVSWDHPLVINRKNETKFSVEVTPPWAVPPLELYSNSAVYIITYTVRQEYGKTASCSFNITVRNESARILKEQVTEKPSEDTFSSTNANLRTIVIGAVIGGIAILLLVLIAFVSRLSLKRQISITQRCTQESDIELESFKRGTLDSTSPLIICSSSYSEVSPVIRREKLRAVSPTFDEEFDFVSLPHKEFPLNKHVVDAESGKPTAGTTEVEIVNERTRDKERRYDRTNSSISNKSTASEISRMMWNISNLPENVNPKMMAWGLVDHNGGRFTIGDTGVSLSIPPQAIPEGHTEGIYIAIMDQEKEHPQITAKESLLSPVVKCGPDGLRFNRPVILSLPHCALLDEGAWNLKVQYNESETSTPADWKQLIDISKQDGSDPCLALLESNVVHLLVDHFTLYAVTGESACHERAKKIVRIVAYVTPPADTDGDCVVRVYCVGDTPLHLENLHSQETKRLGGITRDAPQPFHFIDGGGDLLVNLRDHHPGWKNTGADQKKICFQHIWEGIERMPSRSFMFSLADQSVPQFRATFDITQDCQDGEEQEVNVSTSIKQTSKASVSCTINMSALRLPIK